MPKPETNLPGLCLASVQPVVNHQKRSSERDGSDLAMSSLSCARKWSIADTGPLFIPSAGIYCLSFSRLKWLGQSGRSEAIKGNCLFFVGVCVCAFAVSHFASEDADKRVNANSASTRSKKILLRNLNILWGVSIGWVNPKTRPHGREFLEETCQWRTNLEFKSLCFSFLSLAKVIFLHCSTSSGAPKTDSNIMEAGEPEKSRWRLARWERAQKRAVFILLPTSCM